MFGEYLLLNAPVTQCYKNAQYLMQLLQELAYFLTVSCPMLDSWVGLRPRKPGSFSRGLGWVAKVMD